MNTKVISAVTLTAKQKEKISNQIKKVFQSDSISFSIDNNIIGGIVIKHGDSVVDLSTKNQLRDIQEYLSE